MPKTQKLPKKKLALLKAKPVLDRIENSMNSAALLSKSFRDDYYKAFDFDSDKFFNSVDLNIGRLTDMTIILNKIKDSLFELYNLKK